MSVSAISPRILPAGEYRAEEIPIGARVLYGARDVGRVVLIDDVPGTAGQVIKLGIACSGGRTYFIARFRHEPVTAVEV